MTVAAAPILALAFALASCGKAQSGKTVGAALVREGAEIGSRDRRDRQEATQKFVDFASEAASEAAEEVVRDPSGMANRLEEWTAPSPANPVPPGQPAPIRDAVLREILAQQADGTTRR